MGEEGDKERKKDEDIDFPQSFVFIVLSQMLPGHSEANGWNLSEEITYNQTVCEKNDHYWYGYADCTFLFPSHTKEILYNLLQHWLNHTEDLRKCVNVTYL